MARTYLWVGAFLLLCCRACAVHGNKAVSTSPSPSSSSSSDDDDPLPLCPRAKTYMDRDGSEAVDACSVRPMDRLEHHHYGNGFANGFANEFANDRDIGIAIGNGFDTEIDDNTFGAGLYLHWSQPSVCPAPLTPPIAPDIGLSLTSFFLDRGPEFEPRWKQQVLAMGDKVPLDSHDDDDDTDGIQGQLLAEARRAVAAGEAFTLEAFIAASDRREQERRALEQDDEEEEKSLARNILGVAKNATGYIGSLFKGILPSWVNPTAGQIRRADECFSQVEHVPFRPGCDPHATTCFSSDASTPAASDAVSNGSDTPAASGASAEDIDYGGGGWFYCSQHKRLVQHAPTSVCPSNATAGCNSVETLSPASKTEHSSRSQDEDDDDGEDENADDLLFDALLAADRARYEAEHMKLALFVDPDVHLPAAVEARLARHLAELADERAEFETIFNIIFDRDEQEQQKREEKTQMREQVALERHITTQMQNLLSGGVGEKPCEQAEQPLPPVCEEEDYYLFVPPDESKTQCGALHCDPVPLIYRPPPMDLCASPETLRGNDRHATSPSNCHLHLPEDLARDAPVSVEESVVSSSVYGTAAPPVYFPGPLYNMGTTTQLPGQHWGVDHVVDVLWGAWRDVREAIAPVLCPQPPQGVRFAKAADVTSVNAMHTEPEAACHARQEAAQREATLSSRLFLALAGERKAAAQSADLAAKLAHVQKQLEDAKDAMGEMAMEREIESARARTCNLVLDDTKFEVSELEDALRAILAGEGGQPKWRLERAKVMSDSKACSERLDVVTKTCDATIVKLRGLYESASQRGEACLARLEDSADRTAAILVDQSTLKDKLVSIFQELKACRESAEECRRSRPAPSTQPGS